MKLRCVEPFASIRGCRRTLVVAAMPVLGACCLLTCPVQAQQHSIGLPTIQVMDRNGSHVELLAKLPEMKWHGSPSWSHDGKMVAFDATR